MEKLLIPLTAIMVLLLDWTVGGLVVWLLVEAIFRRELVDALFGPEFGFWQATGVYLLFFVLRKMTHVGHSK